VGHGTTTATQVRHATSWCICTGKLVKNGGERIDVYVKVSNSLSELPNPWWSKSWSGQKEIQKYLQDVADHFGITEHIRFNKRVSEAQWSEKNQMWTVTAESGEQFVANFLINGTGSLHVPRIPDFKG
jgi:cation diffusion facilitator CzcD-associated flavoprotein CzcO